MGFIRVGKTQLVPFQKQLDGSQLRFILRGEDMHEALRDVADAKGGSPGISGTVVAEGQTMRFDGTCNDQPCAMKLTREYPK